MLLTHRQVTTFCRASEALLLPDLGLDNYAERAYVFLEAITPCEFIFFGSLTLGTGVLETGFSQVVPGFEKSMEAYASLMSQYPLYNWDHTVNDGKPFTRSDFFTSRQFREIDIFEEVYKPLGIDDHCAIYVPDVEGEISFFGIERNRSADYTQEERNLLALAQSLLGSARNLAVSRDGMLHSQANPAALNRAGLTPREAEVMTLLAEGKTNEEIGILLDIEMNTVKEHVKRIFNKTGSPNRLAASLWAMRVTREDESRALKRHLPSKRVQMSGEFPHLDQQVN